MIVNAGNNPRTAQRLSYFLCLKPRLVLFLLSFYLSDGSSFDNQGPKPDYEIPDDAQALSSAVDILIKHGQNQRN